MTILIIFNNVDDFWQFWPFSTILTIFENFDNSDHCYIFYNFDNFNIFFTIDDNFHNSEIAFAILTIEKTILETSDIWDTDYNSDHWEPEFSQSFFTWQLIVTLDSIRNYCDVYIEVMIEFLTSKREIRGNVS